MSDAPKTQAGRRHTRRHQIPVEGEIGGDEIGRLVVLGPPGAGKTGRGVAKLLEEILKGKTVVVESVPGKITAEALDRLLGSITSAPSGEFQELTDEEEAEAERVFSKIERELPEAEARAQRLRSLYGI
jgi:hypothetical protein